MNCDSNPCYSEGDSSSSDDEDGSGPQQYSASDPQPPRGAAHLPRPQNPRTLDTISDHGSTTSGSYVVDPEDLCNEINDLFFKDMVV